MKIKTEKYHTNNLYEASFLLASKCKLVGKEKNGKKVTVIFEGVDVQTLAMSFYSGAKISAKDLTDSYRTLKDFVFEN